MKQKTGFGVLAVVVACGAGLAAQSNAAGQSDKSTNTQSITVTGCLKSGQGSDTRGTSGTSTTASTSTTAGSSSTFMLTNARMGSGADSTSSAGSSTSSSTTAKTGTSGTAMSYML